MKTYKDLIAAVCVFLIIGGTTYLTYNYAIVPINHFFFNKLAYWQILLILGTYNALRYKIKTEDKE